MPPALIHATVVLLLVILQHEHGVLQSLAISMQGAASRSHGQQLASLFVCFKPLSGCKAC